MFFVVVLEIADGWGLPRESMSFTDFDIKKKAPGIVQGFHHGLNATSYLRYTILTIVLYIRYLMQCALHTDACSEHT